MDNPIKDNRIVSDTTFALRLKNFIEKVNVCDQPSEEEKEYLLKVTEKLIAYQIQTVRTKEELEYFKNNGLWK